MLRIVLIAVAILTCGFIFTPQPPFVSAPPVPGTCPGGGKLQFNNPCNAVLYLNLLK
jgi:hypothetical protein